MSDGPIGQIFALQPEGVVGGDINPLNMELLRGGGSDSSTFFRDLDYMDMLEAAEDEELFRMLGVNSSVPTPEFPTAQEVLESQQTDAAQGYVDAVAMYMRPNPYGVTQSEAKKILDDAKAKLVELDVSRDQLNEAGIDASRGISGVMGPSISGALEGAVERGSELFGLGAEGIASLIGADKALSSALLNVPKPGVTFVFGDSGQKTPIITGKTPAGTQVGVNVSDPWGIADILGEGGNWEDILVAGGRAAAARAARNSYADDDDKTKKTGVDTGVNVTLGDESGADPADKVSDASTAGDAVDIIDRTPTGRVPVDGLKLPDRPVAIDMPTLDLPSNRTLTIEGFDPTATERVPTSTTTSAEDKTPADRIPGGGGEGGGGGGGGGLPEGQAGVRTVSGGPGPSVDIDYLYDFARGLEQPFQATEDEEEGDKVKKFDKGGLLGLDAKTTGLLGAAVGGLFGGLGGSGDTQGSQGYTGGIPALTASRELVPDAFAMEGRRPGEAGRRYFTDVQYTPVTDEAGLPTIMGGAELAAMNQAALDRQKELSELGQGLLGIYGQKLADEAAEQATEQATQQVEQVTEQATTTPFTLTAADGTTSTTNVAVKKKPAFAPINPDAPVYGPAVPTLESLDVNVADGIDDTEANAVFDLLDREFYTPTEVAEFYGFTPDEVLNAYRAMGGTTFAQGGDVNSYYLGGPTDGMADQIPATINNMEPARLSDGEFVIPADVVSHLGNGNSDAGAENLYSMMERVRKDRTGNPKQGKQIDPNKYLA